MIGGVNVRGIWGWGWRGRCFYAFFDTYHVFIVEGVLGLGLELFVVCGLGRLFLVFVLTFIDLTTCTRDLAMANGIVSDRKCRIVKDDMAVGNITNIKAIASMGNGCALGIGSTSGSMLIFSCMNVAPRRIGIGGQDMVGIALRTSTMLLRSIIMVNCTTIPHESLAKSMASIDDGRLSGIPMDSIARTLAKHVTNIVIRRDRNAPNTSVSMHIHKNVSVARDGRPLCVVSNFPDRSNVSALSPTRVRAVSILGSTSTATVCNTHNTGNMIMVAAGGNDGSNNGTAIAFSDCINIGGVTGGLSMLGTNRFTELSCRHAL